MIKPTKARAPRVRTAKERLGNIGRVKSLSGAGGVKPSKLRSVPVKPRPVKLQAGGSVSGGASRETDELTLLLARQGDVSRGQAFQAARRLGLAEFEWKNPETGRSGRFHTRMAGEPDPNVQRGPRLPQGMKLEDLYRDPAKEQPRRDLEAEYQAIDARLQQELRDIAMEYERGQQARESLASMQDYEQREAIEGPLNEQNEQEFQRLQVEAERDLENLREFEELEAIQAAIHEAEEPDRVRRHEEIQRLWAQQQQILRAIQDQQLANLQAEIDTSEEGVRQQKRAKFQGEKDMYAREQAALQREIDENEEKVLQEWAAGKRQEQALERVYPEAAVIGRGMFGGIMGLFNRLRAIPRPRREEPELGDIQNFPAPRSRPEPDVSPGRLPERMLRFARGGDVAATKMTRATDRGPRTNVMSDAGMGTLDFMKGLKEGEAPKTQDTARAQLDDVLRQLKVRERSVQDATRGMARNTFGAPTLEQPTLEQPTLTKRRFAEGGDVSRETISPGDRMQAFDPTLGERLSGGLQSLFERMGADRYKARKRAQTIMGGPSSNLPLNMGMTDIAASVSAPAALAMAPVYASQGMKDIGEASAAANRGDYAGAGMEGASGALNLLPMVSGVTGLARRVLNPKEASKEVLYESPRSNVRRTEEPASQAAPNIQPVQTVPMPDGRFATTTQLSEVKQIRTGYDTLDSPGAVAHLTAGLRKSPQEQLVAVVADENNKPLQVIRHTIGLSNQASAEPFSLVGAVANVPGARSFWLSHNHPSGATNLSNSDIRLAEALQTLTRDTGLDMRGILSIGGGKFGFSDLKSSLLQDVPIPPRVRDKTVTMSERTFRRSGVLDNQGINAPSDAMRMADQIAGDQTGVILMNNQLQPVGFMPIKEAELMNLRKSGESNRLLAAMERANAPKAMLVSKKPLDNAAIGNVSSLFQISGVNLVDVIDGPQRQSLMNTIGRIPPAPVFKTAAPIGAGLAAAGAMSPEEGFAQGGPVNKHDAFIKAKA